MKMVMLTYNEAVDVDVMEVLNSFGLINYTRAPRMHGKGTTSGTHLGSLVWPGLNNILFVACDDEQANKVVSGIINLRKTLGKEGVKAFVMPIDQIT